MKLIKKHKILSVLVILVLGLFGLNQTPYGTSFGRGGSSFGGSSPLYVAYSNLTSATGTPCALVGPSATSSIQSFIMDITTSTSSAGILVVGTSTSPYATSTDPMLTITIPANTQRTFTVQLPTNDDMIEPNTYVVAGLTNGSGVKYGYTYGGSCKALITLPN